MIETKPMAPKSNVSAKMIERILADGIPVHEAIFHAAVQNATGAPEERFVDGSVNKSRNVQMVWTQDGLYCSQKNVKGELRSFVIPASTVKVAFFK